MSQSIKWRMSAFADLSGKGGTIVAGRWHSRGRPVVYLTDSPSSAMLETLVHLELDADDLPETYKLLKVGIPDDAVILEVGELPEDWRDLQEYTRGIGDQWLREGESLLLSVPSAVMPHTENFLFNPLHPDAGKAELEVEEHRFDRRLLKP